MLKVIQDHGYKLYGPTVRDEAIVYEELGSAEDLPIGWGDDQEAGRYRLRKRGDRAYFGYNLGQHSWKKYLFPPREKLWSGTKKGSKIQIIEERPATEKMAFIGVRACEVQALFVQDKVFKNPIAAYQQYQARRDNVFILAVNCTTAAKTCFCTSMGTGPEVRAGYDIAVTEVIERSCHYFVVQAGSDLGKAICVEVQLEPADKHKCELAHAKVEEAKGQMQRRVDNANAHEVLKNTYASPVWDKVAERCINCANCTLVCPTCFCSNTEDKVSLDGSQMERWQSWDSCFNLSHSYIHGGSVRSSAQSRYRQWLTHKFGTWWNQFGVSGCVGCGRCIAWCPVGIDVTEELSKLQLEYDEKT